MAKGKTVTPPEISGAQRLCDKFHKTQVVVVSVDETGEMSVHSYGNSKKNKELASAGSMMIKRVLGIK